MARVLVTDGEQRAALAVVRSLGRASHEVHVVAARAPSLAGASRHAVTERRVPHPALDPRGYARAVAETLGATRAEILLPITDASLFALLPLGAELPGVRIPFPPLDRVRAVAEKTRVFETARELGIRVPGERVLATPREAADLDPSALSYPLVVKPARSVAETDGSPATAVGEPSRNGPAGRLVKLAVRHVAGPEGLGPALAGLPAGAYPVHLQERIEGPGVGIFLLLWDGEVVARFAHRRLREKPPSGGVSVYRESIAAEPAWVERSRRLLERFDWRGVAMVEYKVDARTGEPYLMEVNGRFWGSLQLAIDAGVDFPRMLVDLALGRPVTPVKAYRTGVRCRWLWGDVDQLASRLRGSRAELGLPAGSPGRLAAVGEFLAAFARGRNEVFRLSDPAPAWRETVEWVRSLAENRRRERGSA